MKITNSCDPQSHWFCSGWTVDNIAVKHDCELSTHSRCGCTSAAWFKRSFGMHALHVAICQSIPMSPLYITCQNVHRCFSLCDLQTAPPSATLAVWVPMPSLAHPASYMPSLANQASYQSSSWSKPRLPIDDVLRGQTLSLNNRPSCYPSGKRCEHFHWVSALQLQSQCCQQWR